MSDRGVVLVEFPDGHREAVWADDIPVEAEPIDLTNPNNYTEEDAVLLLRLLGFDVEEQQGSS